MHFSYWYSRDGFSRLNLSVRFSNAGGESKASDAQLEFKIIKNSITATLKWLIVFLIIAPFQVHDHVHILGLLLMFPQGEAGVEYL